MRFGYLFAKTTWGQPHMSVVLNGQSYTVAPDNAASVTIGSTSTTRVVTYNGPASIYQIVNGTPLSTPIKKPVQTPGQRTASAG